TGPALASLRAQGFECLAVPRHEFIEDETRWILERIRDDPPDVFVPNLVLAGYFAARWARAAGIPTVGVMHSDDSYYHALSGEFVFGGEQYQLSAVACVSAELERALVDRHPQRTVVRRIPCGVPISSRRVARHSADTLRLAYVGRLAEEQKRISDVARAFCRVANEIGGVSATIYGDGPDSEGVARILEREANGAAVRMGGLIDSGEVQSRLLECDVIVLLSDYEGLPIALMEAMSCGCVPVCLRGRSGISELVSDGVTGLIVDDRGDGFVHAIRRLTDEPGLWTRLSQAARIRVAEHYSAQVAAEKWAVLLVEMARAAPSTRRAIRIPRRLRLPPPNRNLEAPHQRSRPPALPLRVVRRARMLAGRLRRTILRKPLP
ncbi:MAG: glycosyltransferase family 4 protein, partial [Gemmatimonadota bacterium]|nr:glycosyltransferase family 4 protein [Gemmatimonadota bacterium]